MESLRDSFFFLFIKPKFCRSHMLTLESVRKGTDWELP